MIFGLELWQEGLALWSPRIKRDVSPETTYQNVQKSKTVMFMSCFGTCAPSYEVEISAALLLRVYALPVSPGKS
jgi:hypothetical protein